MAEADWTFLADGASAASIDRGVTTGITPPTGGGLYTFGFNSLVATPGAVGLYANQVNFNPLAKGGSVRGAVSRLPSGGNTGFSPFFFIGAQGNSVNDNAYLLGLEDDDPHQIVLVKGPIASGIPDDDVGSGGVLAKSTLEQAADTWVSLRLDMVTNGIGDVRLFGFYSYGSVGSQAWTDAFSGEIVDDGLGILSGSTPYTGGRVGFGFRSEAATRRAAFDHVEVYRQI